MKVSLIVPTRNKVAFVERAALSYLGQDYIGGPLEIVFFDQRSSDGTREKLIDLMGRYDGRHRVRVLDCPDNSGFASRAQAINADINWVHGEIEGDVILWGNADDYAYPQRVSRTAGAFAEFSPSWVACSQYVMSADLRILGETVGGPSRWITMAEAVQYQVGSSGALAYSRELWERHGPMREIEQNDIVLPVMAGLEKGMYYVGEVLQAFVQYADPDNQGLGGRIAAARTNAERAQLEETNAFNLSSNWMSVLRRLTEAGVSVDPAVMVNINALLWANLQEWERLRREMTLAGVRPIALHGKP